MWYTRGRSRDRRGRSDRIGYARANAGCRSEPPVPYVYPADCRVAVSRWNGPVAQWIEQGTPKPLVGGSIPSGPAKPYPARVSGV